MTLSFFKELKRRKVFTVGIGYLVIAVILFVEAVLMWNDNREKSYIFLVLGVLAVFMYFFRKKYRKRFEQYEKNRPKKKNGKLRNRVAGYSVSGIIYSVGMIHAWR